MASAKNAVPFTGCFKRRSHRALPRFQQMEIPYTFPKFPQIMAKRIVAKRISKKEGGVQTRDHPCSKAYDAFLACVRRCPDSYQKKCRTEAGKYLACMKENENWKSQPRSTYMRFLEHFQLFAEGTQSREEGIGRFLYKDPTPRTHGAGTVMEFGRTQGGAAGRQAQPGGKSENDKPEE
mmetsp:Transcript_4095/g.7474  ORF Transcript_4095/g.7474 Transcript_4095/m.7474 type:complete len:179 (+) Transcript_4095:113-649(+)